MNPVETKRCSLPKGARRPPLAIHFHFVDGSMETFIQKNARLATEIRQRINAPNLFNQARIVVADDYSKSVFVCSQINQVDFSFPGDGFAHIPDDHADLVEISAAEFRRHVPFPNPSWLEKRAERRRVGDLQISFHNLRMRGGSRVYLMQEMLVKLPAESQSYMQRYLSKSTLGIRLPEGGESFLNLANLIGYTVYPGVSQIPADSWVAQPDSTYDTPQSFPL